MNTKKIAEFLHENMGIQPKIALVLGSGLGDLADLMEDSQIIDYKDIPGFPISTVPGHAGRMVFGRFSGKECVIMQGRFHYYEGYDATTIAMYIRVLKDLGVEKLILTNAAGGVNLGFKPGDLMVITDHINFASVNSLIGSNDESYGPRFFDVSDAYSKQMIGIIDEAAYETGIMLHHGVYMMFTGPCYETPAEIKMARILGADAVGMSTVPEIIMASHCSIMAAGISCITNMAAGILDEPISHEEVMETGIMVKEKFKVLILKIVSKL